METPYELPKDFEKLSHKFILDALREQRAEEAPPAEMPPVVPAYEEGVEATASVAYQEPMLEPGKKYFRIGEVSELIGVEPYVLRYWESEFAEVRPVKSGSGHRVYRRRDVRALHYIRHLLHVEKYSIKGAKRRLETRKHEEAATETTRKHNRENLKSIAHQLRELIQVARANPGTF